MVMKNQPVVFLVTTSCYLVGEYQHFAGICYPENEANIVFKNTDTHLPDFKPEDYNNSAMFPYMAHYVEIHV
jgi:hypothetical protein